MATYPKLDIQWSPLSNKFITWGTEVSLFETDTIIEGSAISEGIKLSNSTKANLLATNSNYHYIKCIDIYPKVDSDLLLAVGQASGKVTLTTFGPSLLDSSELPGKELAPRHPRQCNTVAWNPIDCNIIAAGFDKYRTDHSIFLWDIMKFDKNGSRIGLSSNNAPTTIKPVADFGVSESTYSLAWFYTQPKRMAAGMNLKTIKLIDFRDSNKDVKSTPTKAVYGVCIDPHNDFHLASFFETQTLVWDTRNFEKPIVTLVHPKPIVRISWCPTRHNLLAHLQKDSTVINLSDIQHTMVGNEEVEPSVLERPVVPGSAHSLTSFSWHPSDENRLLAIDTNGHITDYVVCDRITLNWAPNSTLVWTYGRKTLKCINEKTPIYESFQDISTKIKQRTALEYGLKDDLRLNGELTGEQHLINVWNWLHMSKTIVEEGVLAGSQSKHPGVRSVLKIDNPGSNFLKSEAISIPWSELGNSCSYGLVKMYKSEDREKALHLCGWGFDKDSTAFVAFLDQLEKQHSYTRAATIAVFNLKMRTAIEILNRGAEKLSESNLTVVAMALAGFSDDRNSLWRQFCSRAQLTDPYLKAMFAFLTAENHSYENVLAETTISVEDLVAFSCMYLSDSKLNEYLNNMTAILINKGNLEGFLLTGNSMEGIQLLQRYLDATGDIQTAVLIAVKAFPPDVLQEYSVQIWLTSYRNLLDSWKLWNERALFDIMMRANSPTDKPPQQVYVSCNFCGKSISAYMQGLNRNRGPFSRLGGSANKMKMSSCPNCRKPLPRCAICLMHMGTAIQPNETDNGKPVEFSYWFTWCQTCRHGGHATHMTNWFKEHSECPVTPCTCRCFSVDTVINNRTCVH